MKKLFLISAACLFALLSASAQKTAKPFRAYLYNNEYEVFMRLDLYDESITVPGQDLELQMINDYGSEDLTATLTAENDSLYVLKQVEGSTLKVPKEGKWQKLPSKLVLKHR